MYNKPLKVFKGVDNFFDIAIQDFEQQPVPVKIYTFRFRAIDHNEVAVISKDISFKIDDPTKLALNITRDELADLTLGFYKWGISADDGEGNERPIYLDLNGGAEGSMEISDWNYADDALATAVLSTWRSEENSQDTDQLITSEVILDVLDQSQISPLHTVAIFKPATVDGTVYVEASASNVVSLWSRPREFLLTAGSTSTYVNFYGVYGKIRFRFIPSNFNSGTPGTVYYRLF